jgi:hypothetical protein
MFDPQKIERRLTELQAILKAWQALKAKDPAKRTKTDKRRQEEIESELNAILEPATRSELIVDHFMVARFFGVSVRSIQGWSQLKGCPRLKRGHYDLLAVFQWWIENINGGGSEAEQNVRLEYWRWKTENERMRAQQTSSELLPKDDVLTMWANRLREVWSGLYLLEQRLPPELHGKDIPEMQQIIHREVKRINEAYCKDGRFCKVKPKKGEPVEGKPEIVIRKRGRPKKK